MKENIYKKKYIFKDNIVSLAIGSICIGVIIVSICIYILSLVKLENSYIFHLSAGIGIIATIAYMFFTYSVIEVTEEKIIFKSHGTIKKQYYTDGYLYASHIIKHNFYGIPTSTSRYLKICSKENGRVFEISCSNLPKNSFEQMISIMNNFSQKAKVEYSTENAQSENEHAKNVKNESIRNKSPNIEAHPNQVFIIPCDWLLQEEKKLITKTLIISLLAIWGTCGILFILGISNAQKTGHGTIYVMFILICLILFSMVPLITLLIRYFMIRKKMPNKIIIDENIVSIDGTIFKKESIEFISMSPVQIQGSGNMWGIRKMQIHFAGKIYDYVLGRERKYCIYEDYSLLADSLQMNFEDIPGKFRYGF